MRLVLGFLVVLCAVVVAPRAMASAEFNRLYVFGDSYSDMGAGYLAGNGPTSVAYMAQRMNLPFTHSKDKNANSESIDFAVAGADTGLNPGVKTNGLMLEVGMINQVQDFAARVRDKSITFDPDKTLFFIAGGLNDDKTSLDVSVAHITRQIEILKSVGARHIVLARLPTQMSDFSEAAKRLNPAYEKLVPALRQKLGIDLRFSQWGSYFDEIVSHPEAYGIVNAKDPCAFSEPLGEKRAPPCSDPRKYFYYYSSHPSSWVNKLVGDKLYEELAVQR
ncbi:MULTISPECIES: SGNH/GDSL hydrolase family protein [unclassified Dyella]|uniref:SGNH/GDSL hydrolase family protein n=1 Tax=unclassified Dyella TaxID=2634549 RepID=UPI000CADADE7|nr:MULTISPECIES: SGNH/GDSL hydrolase family protein [unclassified Dyella]MDR3447007.1 SGNH/GDSL hydrolase family protein [Dyella sp.]PMQ05852.1 Thermolabile hemolysin [Dyella sp. AD56]